jgi:protease I
VNAGGRWQDNAVVVDNGVITSGNPDDLGTFAVKIIEQVAKSLQALSAA